MLVTYDRQARIPAEARPQTGVFRIQQNPDAQSPCAGREAPEAGPFPPSAAFLSYPLGAGGAGRERRNEGLLGEGGDVAASHAEELLRLIWSSSRSKRGPAAWIRVGVGVGAVRRERSAWRRANRKREVVLRISSRQGARRVLDDPVAERDWPPIAVRLQALAAEREVEEAVECREGPWFHLVSLVLRDGRTVPVWGCESEAEAPEPVLRIACASRREAEEQGLVCELTPDGELKIRPQKGIPLVQRCCLALRAGVAHHRAAGVPTRRTAKSFIS